MSVHANRHLHRAVRIYRQTPPRSPAENLMRLVAGGRLVRKRSCETLADWRVVEWSVALAAARAEARRVIAVGCEEGAMAVHFASA